MATSQSVRSSPRRQHPKEYSAWKAMRARCYNPANSSWQYYGEKGITVCDRWRDSFDNFLADIGKAPSPKSSIDRIDNALGYAPGNVRWATSSEQQHNTSKCLWIEWQGRRMLAVDWAKETGIPEGTIKCRLSRFKWSVEKTLTTPPYATLNRPREKERPVRNSARQVTHNGETRSANYWALKLGVSIGTMYYRLRLGWSVAEIESYYTGLHPIDRN